MPRFSIAAGNPVYRQEAIPPLTVGSFWIKPSTVQTSICDGTQWIRLAEFSDVEANSRLQITGNEFTGFYSGLDNVPTRAQAIVRDVIQDVYNATSAGAGIFQNTDATRSSATFDTSAEAYVSGAQGAGFWEMIRDEVNRQLSQVQVIEDYVITPSTSSQISKIFTYNGNNTYENIELSTYNAEGVLINSTFAGYDSEEAGDPAPVRAYSLSAPLNLNGASALKITYNLNGSPAPQGVKTLDPNTPVPAQNGVLALRSFWRRNPTSRRGDNQTFNNTARTRVLQHIL